MAGHSKWSKVKHKKAITDAKKSKAFSKLAQLIMVESRKAKGDASSPALRAVIERARAANMPALNIEKAIKKGVGAEAEILEEVVYETYGPGGTAIIIKGITDNKNRSANETKHILSKNNASLAAPGSAVWAFSKSDSGWVPNITVKLSESDSRAFEKLIEELEENEAVQEIYTNAI